MRDAFIHQGKRTQHISIRFQREEQFGDSIVIHCVPTITSEVTNSRRTVRRLSRIHIELRNNNVKCLKIPFWIDGLGEPQELKCREAILFHYK